MNKLQLSAVKYIESKSIGSKETNPTDNTISINIHFHPDRLFNERNILELFLEDGKYHSQFVTKTSNGGLTAYQGGDRWNWESRMFGGIYDQCEPNERVKYGSLNFRKRSIGGSPRFGSCYFILKPHALLNSTFVYPDSYYNPTDFAVYSSIQQLIDICLADAHKQDYLDDYIETQIHGDIVIERDVDTLVMDPCFKDTIFEEYAKRLPCKLEWHPGFILNRETLSKYPEYRGQRIVDIGFELMDKINSDSLTPKDIGEAVKNGTYDPQDLKKVYHYLARYGHSIFHPITTTTIK